MLTCACKLTSMITPRCFIIILFIYVPWYFILDYLYTIMSLVVLFGLFAIVVLISSIIQIDSVFLYPPSTSLRVMVLLLRVRLHTFLLEIITIYHLAVVWPCLDQPLADTELSVSLEPSVLVSGFRCCSLHWWVHSKGWSRYACLLGWVYP